MLYYAYIIYSPKRNIYYVGSCKNLERRIHKHNTNHKGYTGGIGDWKLVYNEEYSSKIDAMRREREIKSWKSRKIIDRLIGLAHPNKSEGL